MNQEILMSIRPQHLVNILNGKKTIELRKKFPSDYRGWVYCYCAKTKPYITQQSKSQFTIRESKDFTNLINGKVVCRFWVDNVECWSDDLEELAITTGQSLPYNYMGYECFIQKIERDAKLDLEIFNKYIGENKECYLIHISQLEIFDNPKELTDFYYYKKKLIDCGMDCPPYFDEVKTQVHKAPQSWRYIYIEEDK